MTDTLKGLKEKLSLSGVYIYTPIAMNRWNRKLVRQTNSNAPGNSPWLYQPPEEYYKTSDVLKEVAELVEALEKAVDQLELFNFAKDEQRVRNADTLLREALAKFRGEKV